MSDELSEAEIAAIEARAAAAAAAPWESVPTLNGGSVVHLSDGDSCYLEHGPTCAFIAHARTDIPRLFSALRAAKARAQKAEEIAAAERALRKAESACWNACANGGMRDQIRASEHEANARAALVALGVSP